MNDYKNLGYANGWEKLPIEVKNCQKAHHPRSTKSIGKCLIEIKCVTCKYIYKVDSSD